MLAQIMLYLWIAVIILASVVEILTLSLVSIWFVPPAVISLILAFLEVPVWIQTIVFFIISLILIILSRVFLKKFINQKRENTNSDSLIGKSAIVTEEINNLEGAGAVKINGLEWTARAEDNDVIFEKGLIVTIIKIEGVKLICSR